MVLEAQLELLAHKCHASVAGFAGHVLQNTAASLVCRESVDVMAARRGGGKACGLYAEVAGADLGGNVFFF